MNEIETIKTALNKLIAVLTQALTEIQDKLNQHEQQGYQGLNKWYRTNRGHIIYAVELNQFNCYGLRVKTELNRETHWCNDFALQLNIINCLATESEIKQAILKGCEQKGIVEGARVRCLTCYDVIYEVFLSSFHYSEKNNTAVLLSGDGEELFKVFDNGKFAEVVKEENIKCIHPYASATNICIICGGEIEEKPTNECTCKTWTETKECIKKCKELLKECLDLINYYQRIYFQKNTKEANVQTQWLLTKLNKHLNHD